MGEQFARLHQAKRDQVKWIMRKAKVWLDRIDSRAFKRSSRVSSLIVSSEESSNLCNFASLPSSFLVLIWHLSLCGFRACRYLQYKLKFIKNGFHMHSPLCFRYWRFYRFIVFREVKPFIIWFYPPLLDYDVSVQKVVELVVVIPTSPSS